MTEKVCVILEYSKLLTQTLETPWKRKSVFRNSFQGSILSNRHGPIGVKSLFDRKEVQTHWMMMDKRVNMVGGCDAQSLCNISKKHGSTMELKPVPKWYFEETTSFRKSFPNQTVTM